MLTVNHLTLSVRRQPLLREYMAEQYGEKLSTPETVDAETLEAR